MLNCLIYIALIGIVSFGAGRIVKKEGFHFEKAPFAAFSFEKNGKIYEKIGVKKWKEKVPDMSRIFPFLMPSKKMPAKATAAQLRLMLQETCVAEWIHGILCVVGFGCVFLWKGIGGWLMAILNIFGNLPFMIIQRYNRPKLARLYKNVSIREEKEV